MGTLLPRVYEKPLIGAWCDGVMQPRIAVLAGKRPRPATILADVVATLQARGVRCRVLLPHEEHVTPADLHDAHLVVHRGLSRAADVLLAALAQAGTPLCNPWAGVARPRPRSPAPRDRPDGRTGTGRGGGRLVGAGPGRGR